MISRHGYSTISIVLFLAVVAAVVVAKFVDHWIAYPVYALLVVFTALIIYFFRDPDRTITGDENVILSPADGKVVLVEEKIEENVYIGGKAKQVSIFLSPLDVHVNRVPATGTIEYVKYHPGVYLMAWDQRASELNERADFGLLHASGTKIFFRQITGFLARRIVYDLKEGDHVQAGKRFGMMKFGSRMDILVPPNVELTVEQGDRTRAGETVLGKIRKQL